MLQSLDLTPLQKALDSLLFAIERTGTGTARRYAEGQRYSAF